MHWALSVWLKCRVNEKLCNKSLCHVQRNCGGILSKCWQHCKSQELVNIWVHFSLVSSILLTRMDRKKTCLWALSSLSTQIPKVFNNDICEISWSDKNVQNHSWTSMSQCFYRKCRYIYVSQIWQNDILTDWTARQPWGCQVSLYILTLWVICNLK